MREKQIEEMAVILTDGGCTECNCDANGKFNCLAIYSAELLYNAGYHRQSEIAWAIFDDIDEIAYRYLNDADYSGGDMIYDLNELKKKYTEGTNI